MKANKTIVIYLIVVVLLIAAGSAFMWLKRNSTNNGDTHTKLVFNPGGVTLVGGLKGTDGSTLGDIYVAYLNNSKDIVSSLYVVQQFQSENIIVFKATDAGLFNTQGMLLGPGDKFYGYQLSLAKDDYFELHQLSNQGKDASDDLTIKWDYTQKAFEILWPPANP